MGNDPLTSVEAMISMVEPGFRMIDGGLLRELYVKAGKGDVAATIELGFRLIDNQLLRDLAREVHAHRLAEEFRLTQDVGKRLIDGTPWKELALEASEEREEMHGTAHSQIAATAQQESVRTTGEGGGAERSGSGIVPDSRQVPREERSSEGESTRDASGEGQGEGSR